MRTQDINPESIIVRDRHRALDPAKVDALAESMEAIGLMQPISVWVPFSGKDAEVFLVAGYHRLEAAKKLGWEEIACFDVELTETEQELWEIDENLVRSELTADEKREHLRRRKEIWEARQVEERGTRCSTLDVDEVGGTSCPTHDSLGRQKTPQQERGFAAETAAATGMSKRQVNRYLADPKPKPVSPPAEPLNDYEAANKAKSRLIAAWNGAPPETRDWFRQWIETPVFDQSRAGQ